MERYFMSRKSQCFQDIFPKVMHRFNTVLIKILASFYGSRQKDSAVYMERQRRRRSMYGQLCLTFCNPIDCIQPCSSVHGIYQARILERVAFSYSRGSSWPRGWTHIPYISCIGRQILYHCTTQERQKPIEYWRRTKSEAW